MGLASEKDISFLRAKILHRFLQFKIAEDDNTVVSSVAHGSHDIGAVFLMLAVLIYIAYSGFQNFDFCRAFCAPDFLGIKIHLDVICVVYGVPVYGYVVEDGVLAAKSQGVDDIVAIGQIEG